MRYALPPAHSTIAVFSGIPPCHGVVVEDHDDVSPLSKPSAKISAGDVFWMLVPEVSVPPEP